MEVGKLTSSQLQKLVIDQLPLKRSDVLVEPGVGEDCGAISFGDWICVASTDPITGATTDIGRLAVHINCNDIASSGVEPVALLITILVPPKTDKKTVKVIMKQASETASAMNVAIIGGHTEVTDAVTRPLVSATAFGRKRGKTIVTTSGAKPENLLVLTKNVALEGTGILAWDRQADLEAVLSPQEIDYAKSMLSKVSVVPEGVLAGKLGVNAMHDVTEGGVLGAIWEMCEASGVGCIVEESLLPVEPVTQKICDHFELDPLRLISSGVMLMAMTPKQAEKLLPIFDKKGIVATVVGKTTRRKARTLHRGDAFINMDAVKIDELYKVLK